MYLPTVCTADSAYSISAQKKVANVKVRDKDTAYFLRSLKQKLIKDATRQNEKFRLQIDLPTVEKFGLSFRTW